MLPPRSLFHLLLLPLPHTHPSFGSLLSFRRRYCGGVSNSEGVQESDRWHAPGQSKHPLPTVVTHGFSSDAPAVVLIAVSLLVFVLVLVCPPSPSLPLAKKGKMSNSRLPLFFCCLFFFLLPRHGTLLVLLAILSQLQIDRLFGSPLFEVVEFFCLWYPPLSLFFALLMESRIPVLVFCSSPSIWSSDILIFLRGTHIASNLILSCREFISELLVCCHHPCQFNSIVYAACFDHILWHHHCNSGFDCFDTGS